MRILITLIPAFLFFTGFSAAQESYRIAFYNVENLFDTIDDPKTLDEDFTPLGKQQWTLVRYSKKLKNIARVLEAMGSPDFIGLGEVENAAVLTDLTKKTGLAKYWYRFVHYDSPDRRGIDVAFLYKDEAFRVLESSIIRLHFPPEVVADYTSRDILKVKGLLPSGDTLYFFVNHWPSRRGGVKESEPKRLFVAGQLKSAIDLIFAGNPQAKIVLMGDFNDEPINNSIRRVLSALPQDTVFMQGALYNCFTKPERENKGSYYYRGNWDMLDQIMISAGLTGHSSKFQVGNPVIFSREWMMYNDKRNGPRPNRTYGGPRYYGGFSDHLPVFVDLVKRKN